MRTGHISAGAGFRVEQNDAGGQCKGAAVASSGRCPHHVGT
jgi:hypothetical protein